MPFTDTPALEATSLDGTRLALFGVLPAGDAESVASAPAAGPPAHPGDRPALLLVHGAAADHTTWRVVGPDFASTRATFALDRRGRGSSGDGAGDYAIEREYEDVAAAVEAIGQAAGAPVDVVGHSYGGRCALGASLVTDAMRRVVVYESAPVPPGMSYQPPGLIEAIRAALERDDREAALSTFLSGIVGMSEADLAAYRADAVWPLRVAAAHTILREIESEATAAASLEQLASVGAPVLLILGSVSRSPFRIGTEALAARLAHARIVTIEGAAHAAHHTHAARFVDVVERFLDQTLDTGRTIAG